jgi:hypothetical protein
MRIRMKSAAAGSEDGFTSRDYAEGQEYDVGEALAASFVASGLAELVAPDATEAGEPEPSPRRRSRAKD